MDRRRSVASSLLAVAMVMVVAVVADDKCPWADGAHDFDLHSSSCTCSYVQSKLNVHCAAVNVSRLLEALSADNSTTVIESLQVVNGSLPTLDRNAFGDDVRVTSVSLVRCGLREIGDGALSTANLEDGLLSLGLVDNELTAASLPRLRTLRSLSSLDLSGNRIRRLDAGAFAGLESLDTLGLMRNADLSLDANAFGGLESTLKNLNLKGIGLKAMPSAIANLTALAFLDLAQNSIETIDASFFASMHSLTALSLERNRLVELHPDAFRGLEDTMSSLSLLNNGFKATPTKSVVTLRELRVLDLGFNRIERIDDDAFQNLTKLTLLALDGNPLVTLSFDALKHLHSTLRGLSIGGKSLVCDCRLRWIAEWVREYDLQVTSRERNPQFCGHPESQRNKNLYLLRPAQLVCLETTTTPSTTTTTATTTEPSTTTTTAATTTIPTTAVTVPRAKSMDEANATADPSASVFRIPLNATTANNNNNDTNSNQRSARKETPSVGQDIVIRDAFREDTNVVITWEPAAAATTTGSNAVAGYRVVYRTFGDDRFKEGAVLPLRVRKFRMTNVPTSECCLIVCVVGLSEPADLTLDAVPTSNCRELQSSDATGGGGSSSSAAGTVGRAGLDVLVVILVVAVGCTLVVAIVVACACRCRSRRRDSSSSHDKSLPLPPPPIADLPPPIKPDWDQTSVYSSRSIPRARAYHMARSGGGGTVNSAYLPDDARSHLSLAKHHPNHHHHGMMQDDGRIVAHGSMIDGQYGGTAGAAGPSASYEHYHAASRSELGRPSSSSSSKPVVSAAMPMPVFHANGGGNNDTMNNNNYRKKKNQMQRNGQHHQHPTAKWATTTTAPSHHGSMRSVNNGYAERETGYFDHPNPWSSASPTDADHYNPNAGHVSRPFGKRDYT